jgi:hypothetical protein
MKTLQGVDGGQIKLHFNEIVWISYNRSVKERVDLLPITKLTSFQSESSNFFKVSTISCSLLLETVHMAFVKP